MNYQKYLGSIKIARYHKDMEQQKRAFRCYKAAPDHAGFQLRGDKSYAHANLKPEDIDDIIKALLELRAEFAG